MVYILINQNKVVELPKRSQVYLTFVESIISFDILVWVGAFVSPISQTCQNQIIRILFHKEQMYSTKYVYPKLNVLCVKEIYLKCTAKYLKIYDLL